MSSTDLTPYGSVAWDEIAGDSHPLELILSRGISVYYKFNRDLYFARIKAADGARFHAKAPIWRPNFVRLASDYDVFLLRLVEENIREIIKTQDCTVAKFVLGGLKASEALSARSSEESWPESLPMWKSDEVEFLECFLVDGFYPDTTDTSVKPHHGAGGVSCNSGRSTATSSSVRRSV